MRPEVKVNFGCGGNILDGWHNHDIEVNIEKPLPYITGGVDFILAEHVAEHMGSHEFLRFCQECLRILRPGGTVRLCMPVLERLDRELGKDIILNHGHLASYSTQLIKDVLFIAGFDRDKIVETERKEIDGHWKVIGEPRDTQETARIEATK